VNLGRQKDSQCKVLKQSPCGKGNLPLVSELGSLLGRQLVEGPAEMVLDAGHHEGCLQRVVCL
jgi:hypothetical protein